MIDGRPVTARSPLLAPIAAALLLVPRAAEADSPCDCDHVIELSAGVVNGTDLGVSPGDSVCVRGGPREYLRLQEFVGAEGSPILIRNCEGQVDIDNDDRGYGLTVDRSRYVRVTGSGDPDFAYGFKVRAARTGPDYSAMGVSISDLSSDIEADHMEVYDSGFAGFNVKTDPRCDGSANLGNFVMHNSKLHHNYIHDTHGEGIYFGSTGYGGRVYNCDGEDVTLYPHEHHGADIHDNIIENTGWDGAQIGVTPVGCAFYRNVIRNVGLAGEMYQQQGLQIGGASACAIWGNVLMDGPTNGIFILGADDTQVYNNLIVGFAGTGIYINDQQLDLDARIQVAHNTVVAAGDRGIAVFGALLGPGFVRNNAVAQAGSQPIGIGGDVVEFADEGNQIADDPAALGFVDAAARDFHLTETSPLRDAGVPVPELAISDDLEGTSRDDAPDVGAYEFSEVAPTTGDTTGSDTTDSDGSDSDSPTTSGGSPGETDSDGDSDGGSGSPTGSASAPTGSDGASTSTSPDSATAGTDTSDSSGCACSSDAGAPPAWLMLLALLGLPRRRATA